MFLHFLFMLFLLFLILILLSVSILSKSLSCLHLCVAHAYIPRDPGHFCGLPGGRHMHIRVYAWRARTCDMTLDIPAAYQGVAICTYVSMHNVCCQSVWCVVIVCK